MRKEHFIFCSSFLKCCKNAHTRQFHVIAHHVVEVMLHAKEVLSLDLIDHVLANLKEQIESSE